ncbi:TetR/AcrR family transcriptional regulator [Streptomyces sp. NPDC007084]|uniref:TetR/AcrR family transcriptional regulator n=1 Tax=Streptomyces sp. NPDC007084 TaxID=3154313 RepID=UPI0034530945
MTPPNDASRPSRAGASPARGRNRENAILATALELVGEGGFDRLTVNEIATKARASKETIYSRWRSKDEIVAEALRRQSEGDVPEIPDTGSLRGDLRQTLDAQAAALDGKGEVSLLSLIGAVRDHPGLRDAVRSHLQRTHKTIGEAIAARAIDRGELRADADVATCITLALAQLLFSALLGGAVPGPADRERLVDQVLLPMLTSN